MAALSLLIADRYGLSVWKSSVEACWPPLTPEHGFPSLQMLSGPNAGRSPSVRSQIPGRRLILSRLLPEGFLQKARRPANTRTAVKSPSIDSLRRHYPRQVKGSKRLLPLSLPAPLLFWLQDIIAGRICQASFSARQKQSDDQNKQKTAGPSRDDGSAVNRVCVSFCRNRQSLRVFPLLRATS